MKKSSLITKFIFSVIVLMIVMLILLSEFIFLDRPIWLGLVMLLAFSIYINFFFYLGLHALYLFFYSQVEMVTTQSLWPLFLYLMQYAYLFYALPENLGYNLLLAFTGACGFLILYASKFRTLNKYVLIFGYALGTIGLYNLMLSSFSLLYGSGNQ